MEARLTREGDEAADRVFVRIFRQDFFARAKLKCAAADFHRLVDFTNQIKRDPAFGGIVRRVMLPVRQIETAVKVAIDVREEILVELRGYARAVVVRRLDDMSIFLEIDAD